MTARIVVDRVWHPDRETGCVEHDIVCVERDDGKVVDVTRAYVRPAFVDHYGDQHELEEPSTTLHLYRRGDLYILRADYAEAWAGYDRFERYEGAFPGEPIASASFRKSDNDVFDTMATEVRCDAATGMLSAHRRDGTRVRDIGPFDFFFGNRTRGLLATTVLHAGVVTFAFPHPAGDFAPPAPHGASPPPSQSSISDSIAAILAETPTYAEPGVESPEDEREVIARPALAAAVSRPGASRHELVDEASALHDLDVERLRILRRHPDGSHVRIQTVEVRRA